MVSHAASNLLNSLVLLFVCFAIKVGAPHWKMLGWMMIDLPSLLLAGGEKERMSKATDFYKLILPSRLDKKEEEKRENRKKSEQMRCEQMLN